MLTNVLRDAALVDAVRTALVPLQAYLAEAVAILAAGWPARGRRRRVLEAALHHAIDFHTWRSLARSDRITRTETAELAIALVASAAERPGSTA